VSNNTVKALCVVMTLVLLSLARSGRMSYFTTGEYYEGSWSHNCRHGFGTLFRRNGAVFRGEWVWDEPSESLARLMAQVLLLPFPYAVCCCSHCKTYPHKQPVPYTVVFLQDGKSPLRPSSARSALSEASESTVQTATLRWP
jgi:hypothetical protein